MWPSLKKRFILFIIQEIFVYLKFEDFLLCFFLELLQFQLLVQIYGSYQINFQVCLKERVEIISFSQMNIQLFQLGYCSSIAFKDDFFFFNDTNELIYLFIYLLIFGCVGSLFLCEGFLQLRQAGATLHRSVRASHYRGLSCCGAQAPDAQAQ